MISFDAIGDPGHETMSDKFIAFHRLIDACQGAGCPVCRCLLADTRRYLTTVLYEHVTDPDSRARLRASWGFCNWHAEMLPEIGNAAFGAAILSEDLLRVLTRRLERWARRPITRSPSLFGRLRALLGRARIPAIVRLHHRRAVCPACAEVADSDRRYVETTLGFVRDPQFEEAYESSQGICVPHALRALELADGGAAGERLLALTLPKWAALRRDLAGFVRKHDHRNREPYTEAESDAYLRAIEALTGYAGLFANDLRQGTRSGRRSGSGRQSR